MGIIQGAGNLVCLYCACFRNSIAYNFVLFVWYPGQNACSLLDGGSRNISGANPTPFHPIDFKKWVKSTSRPRSCKSIFCYSDHKLAREIPAELTLELLKMQDRSSLSVEAGGANVTKLDIDQNEAVHVPSGCSYHPQSQSKCKGQTPLRALVEANLRIMPLRRMDYGSVFRNLSPFVMLG